MSGADAVGSDWPVMAWGGSASFFFLPFSRSYSTIICISLFIICGAGKEKRVKTLYTGHVAIGTHNVYSFIYADTLLEAEEHLTKLLTRYLREHHSFPLYAMPAVKVVSRPGGWDPPDGYYLPGTSAQYALRYPTHRRSSVSQRPGAVRQTGALPELPQQPIFPPCNVASH